MPGLHALISLAGEVALLLWGVHMVRSGVERAFGSRLRSTLRTALRHRPTAFLAGLGVTAAIQSSTATALMTGSFVASGLIALTPGLAAMLGANVGSALIVQALSFNTSLAYPLLILAGLIAFRRGRPPIHDLGRAGIGLGLMLLALHLLVETVSPASVGPAERTLLASMTDDPLACFLVVAVVTCAAHSSVAIVAVIMSLAAAGLIGPPTVLAMVLGANLGSAINPALAFARADRASLRLALGNLLTRAVGCMIALPLLPHVLEVANRLALNTGHMAASFHLAFNLALAAGFILLLPLVARLLTRLIPERPSARDPRAPRHLDPAALETPTVALANATREALRMADVLASMLQGAQAALHANDRQKVAEIRRMDDVLDGLNGAIERYISKVRSQNLTPTDSRRLGEILAFATNLEHAGDVVDRSLMAVAMKQIKGDVRLHPDALVLIDEMFTRLASDIKLAAAVFLTRDPLSARQLFEAKERFRDMEWRATEEHFERVCTGKLDSLGIDALLLDTLRDLKRVGTHIAATAQPVLRQHNLLQRSRLVSLSA